MGVGVERASSAVLLDLGIASVVVSDVASICSHRVRCEVGVRERLAKDSPFVLRLNDGYAARQHAQAFGAIDLASLIL
jgi:hypothetical protein